MSLTSRYACGATRIVSVFALVALSVGVALGSGVDAGSGAQNANRVKALEKSLYFSHAFWQPLVPMGRTDATEDEALQQAVDRFMSGNGEEALQSLDTFMVQYPHSPWRVALLANEGHINYENGYFDRAIADYREAWQLGRPYTGTKQRVLVNADFGELILMQARLGHAKNVAALLTEAKGRQLTGAAAAWTEGAREGLAEMLNSPGIAYLCGPAAVRNVLLTLHPHSPKAAILEAYRSGPHGVNFATVAKLAKQVGLHYRMAYNKNPGTTLPVPAVVHWRVNHYAAVIGFSHGMYHVLDPTFGVNDELWITPRALAYESDGYYLIPDKTFGSQWASVSVKQAKAVYGMGYTGNSNPYGTTYNDVCSCPKGKPTAESATPTGKPGTGPNAPKHKGMPVADALMMLVSLRITDTPLSYTPPIGPPIRITVTYNQKDATETGNYDFGNLGPLWGMSWLSYIKAYTGFLQEDESVTHVYAGGGSTGVSGADCNGQWDCTYLPDQFGYQLRRTRTNGTDTFTLTYPSGRVDTFALGEPGANDSEKFFLTSVTDPQGNSVTLGYSNDGEYRLTSLTDAIGQVTTFQYNDPNDPLKITGVTDPFGRTAAFNYTSGVLTSITDEIGQTSSFGYETAVSADFIDSMTTPYGTSAFTYDETTRSSGGDTLFDRWLTMTDPLGHTQRVEYRDEAPGIPYTVPACPSSGGDPSFSCHTQYQYWRDSYYWSATNTYNPNDFSNAVRYHWLHQANSQPTETSRALENITYPGQATIWFNYQGQSSSIYTGNLDYPSATAVLLQSGASQITVSDRNILGNVTCYEDASGRITRYDYASNYVDLEDVRQGTGGDSCANGNGSYDTVAAFGGYNGHHLPATYTDAAGEETAFTYNAAGELHTVTNVLAQTTTFNHNGQGYLTSVLAPGAATVASYTYGPKGRVATATDAGGETRGYTWDNLNRLTSITYPDGTSQSYGYDKLDLSSVTNRLGNQTTFGYNADRELTNIKDPLGNVTLMGYDGNGNLASLTDPDGNETTWQYDPENRLDDKVYADGTKAVYGYEPDTGWLSSVTDPLGQVTSYGYTPAGLVSSIVYSNAQITTAPVGFSYDPYYPRVTSMTDGIGTTTYAYHPVGGLGANQLASVTEPNGAAVIGLLYDALGRVKKRYIGSDVESFNYDPLGRLSGDGNALSNFAFSYLGATGQVTDVTPSAGPFSVTYQYLPNSGDRRLAAVLNQALGGAQDPQSFKYTTDAEDRVTSSQIMQGGTGLQAYKYGYDTANRLTSVTDLTHGGTSTGYFYDSAGNLKKVVAPGGVVAFQATYNNLNQISEANGISYTYNAAGELTSDGTHIYTWDAAHRLLSVTSTVTGATTSYAYDGVGRRVAITAPVPGSSGSAKTYYLWCGMQLCQSRDGSNNVEAKYFSEGEQLSSENLLYARDRLDSVTNLVDGPSGTVEAAYTFGPWGNVTNYVGNSLSSFGYAGMFVDSSTNLNLTLARAYSASQYRWLNRDPVGESVDYNLYRYVFDNSLNFRDPEGLWSVGISLFYDIGGRITFGKNPDGSWFFGGAVGFGFGAGVGYHPDATSPGWVCGATNVYNTLVDSEEAEGSVNYAGYYIDSSSYWRIVPPITAAGQPPEPTTSSGWSPWKTESGPSLGIGTEDLGLGTTATSGAFATLGNGNSSHCSCGHSPSP